MQIEQRRRVRNWADEKPFSSTQWALTAACGMTAALMIGWASGQRHLHRSIDRVPAVVTLERVVIAAERAPVVGRHDVAASATAVRSMVR